MHTDPKLIARMGTYSSPFFWGGGQEQRSLLLRHLGIQPRQPNAFVFFAGSLTVRLSFCTLSPRWRQHVPLKCWQLPVRPQGVAFHCGGPGSVSGQFMWDFSWMNISVFHCHFASTNAPCIYILLMLYNLRSSLHHEWWWKNLTSCLNPKGHSLR